MCRCNREGSILVVMLWMRWWSASCASPSSKTMRVEAQTSANTLLITVAPLPRPGGVVAETIYKLIVYTLETSDRLFNPQQQAEIEPLDIEKGKCDPPHRPRGRRDRHHGRERQDPPQLRRQGTAHEPAPQPGEMAEQKADMISDCILDWRDPDDDHHLNGAETPEYQKMGRNYRVKNAEFETVEELPWSRGSTRTSSTAATSGARGGSPRTCTA